jgi:hypothetical protein
MLVVYQWLQKKLPKPIADGLIILNYIVLILLIVALSGTSSLDFIYWDM